ncbi:recombinase family protein [Brevundimonas sp. DWR2-3-1b1]|uniref:recombinase family protein n=1 Tax=unclassified Brevundimonas TaxID=2622653 RepID=UPI003CED7862
MTSSESSPHKVGMHTRAIIYVRFSSKQQEKGSSVERQLELCRTHIARMGWEEVEVVEDLGRSAWKGDHLSRGNLGILADRIRRSEIGRDHVVLVEKLDRLSRLEVRKTQRWLEDMTDLGVAFATVDGGRIYTADSLRANLMETMEILMRGQLAHQESQQKSERVQSAIAIKRKAARATGAIMNKRIPGWLSVEGDRFVVREDRAAVVRLIFDWTIEGLGARIIARKLNERSDTPSWGKNPKGWDPTWIAELIMSPAVEGDYQPTTIIDGRKVAQGDPIFGYYQHRIVSADRVAQARAARRDRTKTGGGHRLNFSNLFTGSIKCRSCGSAMTMRNGRTTRASVECGSHYRGRGCDQKSVQFAAFERQALDLLLPLALDDRFFSAPTETLRMTNEVADLEKLLTDLTTRSTRLVRMMMTVDEPDPVMVAETRPSFRPCSG